MTLLSITLLGTFTVTLNGQPVTDFGTDKTRALLAYLALEQDRPHRRDALAGLLWAESPRTRARQSLRQALSQLRTALNERAPAAGEESIEPFLLVSRETVQFNPRSEHRLDVVEFGVLDEANQTHRHNRMMSCLPCMGRMEEMTELYGGEFLGGFFLGDSIAFEEWATLQREHLQRRMMGTLTYLAGYHERCGDVRQAIQVAHRQVEVEPWREETHRQLMRLLDLDGQRSAALAQYGACRKAMAEELGVEPTAQTRALYERIKSQERPRIERLYRPPPSPTPPVDREGELLEQANPDGRRKSRNRADSMDKVISLEQAVQVVTPGAILGLGGMTLYRRPAGFVRALLRSGVDDLTLLSLTCGFESDLLVGAGRVRRVRTCYFGLEAFGLAPMYTELASGGELEVIEETEASLAFGLRSSAAGVGFMPSQAWLGTDLPRVRPDVKTVQDPYSDREYIAFPAIRADVVVIHVAVADRLGNAKSYGNLALDREMGLTASTVIMTTERVVDRLEGPLELAGVGVDYVVELPGGAWPTSCYPDYALDGGELLDYVQACNEGEFDAYLAHFVNETEGKKGTPCSVSRDREQNQGESI